MTEWISVKDRLPSLREEVLIWVAEDWNCCDVARYDGARGIFHMWDTNNDLAQYREITHWMPLPKPPEL